MDNTDLITKARELCEEYHRFRLGFLQYDTARVIKTSMQIVPQLCDALEETQREIERLKKHSEDLRLDYGDLLDRAEKAEAERDKLAEFVRWTDDNFNHYMPTEYVQRLRELGDNLPEPPKGE